MLVTNNQPSIQQKEVTEAIRLVTIDAQGIADWAKDHGLQVNLNKTKSLIIGSNSKLKSLNIDSLPPIIINNVPLPYVSQTKCLGLSLNNDLLWKNYVSQTVRKVNAALYTLKSRKNIYTTAIRKLLVTATILPLIDYCTVVLIDATADNNLKLQRALNSSIRFIYNLKRDEHITPYRRKPSYLRELFVEDEARRSERLAIKTNNLYYEMFAENSLTSSYLMDSRGWLAVVSWVGWLSVVPWVGWLSVVPWVGNGG
ncbi:Protein of unknown function [Cotesia congregata]|uniref:Uncharacterized protein n=1 Tax=Cotesia congregata TaxID=51543 RepID=A0A8J2HG50_COTCN|nr:Protein of unknown function [Cotesia congregata]